ncbi:MAG: GAF domain-containing protein [Bryobacteraceae bacterium]
MGQVSAQIRFDAAAVYVLASGVLTPLYMQGKEYQGFLSQEIPLGAGLCGWVAENGKPILNGNPAVEPGYLRDPDRYSSLRSALAVPIRSGNAAGGVLVLYQCERDGFSRGELNFLEVLAGSLPGYLRCLAGPGPAAEPVTEIADPS